MSKFKMSSLNVGKAPSAKTFLPDDFVQRKTEFNTNVVIFMLFGAVMAGVVGAFVVTNRQWEDVRVQQVAVNTEYDAETVKIEQLKVLEKQRRDMLERAEIASMLLEKVPRSILFAEIVNRMPDKLTLTDMNVQSRRVAEAPPKTTNPANQPKSLSAVAGAGKGTDGKGVQVALPRPPKVEFSVVLTGVAPSDADVSDFQAALKECGLLRRVDLKESKAVIIEETSLRQFIIEAQLKPGADTRSLKPLLANRIMPAKAVRNPVELTKGDGADVKKTANAEENK